MYRGLTIAQESVMSGKSRDSSGRSASAHAQPTFMGLHGGSVEG